MKIISYISTYLLSIAVIWAQPELPITKETQALAEVAASIPVSKRIHVPMKGYLPLPIAEFDDALDRLASTVDANTAAKIASHEEDSMIAKIILISIDRRNHPELYQEILLRYFTHPIITESNFGLFSQIGPISPDISPKHTTPSYRNVWEYFLLTCYRERKNAFADWRPSQALGMIADARSAILLGHFYKEQLASNVIRPDPGQIRGVEDAITNMPSTIALDALLKCFVVAEQNEAINKNCFYDTASVRYVIKFKERSSEWLNRWKTVIRDYPKDNLTPSQRQLLQSIMDMQPKDK